MPRAAPASINLERRAMNEGVRLVLALLACLTTAGISTLILDYLDLANIVMLAVAVITSKLAADLQRKAEDARIDALQTRAL